jgi:hypothetical protein
VAAFIQNINNNAVTELNTAQIMKKSVINSKYFPRGQADQMVWYTTFAREIQVLGPGLGYSAAQIAAIVADCRWLIYLLQEWLPAIRNWSQTGTNTLIEAQSGDGSALLVLPTFVPPPLPDGLVPVNTGAQNRVFAEVQNIKNGGKCSDKDQATLGIVGSAQPGPDYTTLQPVFTVSIVGGQVVIKWNFGGYAAFLDAIELQVDRNDGKGFGPLTMDTTPGYTDTQPFPAARTVWTYRGIYLLNDARVGIWSQSVSNAVQATAQA